VFTYVVPIQILGLILTLIGLSKSLSFDNKKNKIFGRIGLIYGFGFLLLGLWMLVSLALSVK